MHTRTGVDFILSKDARDVSVAMFDLFKHASGYVQTVDCLVADGMDLDQAREAADNGYRGDNRAFAWHYLKAGRQAYNTVAILN